MWAGFQGPDVPHTAGGQEGLPSVSTSVTILKNVKKRESHHTSGLTWEVYWKRRVKEQRKGCREEGRDWSLRTRVVEEEERKREGEKEKETGVGKAHL